MLKEHRAQIAFSVQVEDGVLFFAKVLVDAKVPSQLAVAIYHNWQHFRMMSEISVRTIQILAVAGLMAGLAVLNSACTTRPNPNPPDFQYNPRTSRNPACHGGFRPTNNWTCRF